MKTMKTIKITVFNSVITNKKIPKSPFESGEFVFNTVETNINDVFEIISNNFYLNNNFDLNGTYLRRSNQLQHHLTKNIGHIILDIDEVYSQNDANKIFETLKSEDFHFALGKSKSFNGTDNFNLKGVILCDGKNNKDAIRNFVDELNTLIGQYGHVDPSILSVASFQAPTHNGGAIFKHEGMNLYKLSQKAKSTKQISKIPDPSCFLDVCINEFAMRGFHQTNKDSNKNIRIFSHRNEKTPNGYFLFEDHPFIMHHHNGTKINIFETIMKTSASNKYVVEYTQKQQINSIKHKVPNRTQNNIICNEKIMTINKRKSDLISKFIHSKKATLKIKAAMGTGKSIIIQEVVKQCSEQNKRVLFITNRISIANDIKTKTGIKIYSDGDYKEGDNIIVQLESLWKYDLKFFDVVILDEFMSLLLHTRNTLSNHSKINKMKFNYILEHKSYVVADAFLFKTDMFFKKSFTIYNKYLDNVGLYDYQKIDDLIDKMITTLKKPNHKKTKKITISSNNKKMVGVINHILRANNFKTMLLTAETPEHTKKLIYEHFNKENHDAWDALIYTPTLTVGISNLNDISDHFHIDNGMSIDTISSLQMIKRSRKAKNIHFYVKSGRRMMPFDLDTLNKKSLAKMGVDDITIDSTGSVVLTPERIFENKVESIFNALESNHENAFKTLLHEQFKNKILTITPSQRTFNIPSITKDINEESIKNKLSIIENLHQSIYDKNTNTIQLKQLKQIDESKAMTKLITIIKDHVVCDISDDDLFELAKKEIKSNFKYIKTLKNISIFYSDEHKLGVIKQSMESNNNTKGIKFIETTLSLKAHGIKLYNKFSPNLIKSISESNEIILSIPLRTFLREVGYTNKHGTYILGDNILKDASLINQ